MIRVVLSGPLEKAAGNPGPIEMEAASVRELVERLGAAYPALKPTLDKGVSVAVNGQLHHRPTYLALPPGSEVHLLVPLSGG
ncbi:MAG: MoaD/ThiS family protein [Alphaproteobacteria bacterium]